MNAVARFSGFWNALTGPSRRLLISAVAVFGVGIFLLLRLSGGTAYTTIASGVGPGDASAITAKLSSVGVPYTLSNGGTTIQVPASQADQARLDLASLNLVGGTSTGPGLTDLFTKSSGLSATDFEQKVKFNIGVEADLERTLMQNPAISAARVTIAMPEQQLFSANQQPQTASVLLAIRPGMSLSDQQVQGILQTVANGAGLKAENVTITDDQGNILNPAAGTSGVNGAGSRLVAQAAYERAVQSKLDAMLLQILGPGKAVTRVQADLNLDQVTSNTETIDPTKQIVLSKDNSNETLLSGSAVAAGGVAGVSANVPGTVKTTPGTNGTAGGTNYKKSTTQEQTLVDRTRSDIISTPGTVKRLNVSVLLDQSVPASQVATIKQAVAAAAGIDPTRQDQLVVATTPFVNPKSLPAGTLIPGVTATPTAAPKSGLDVIGIAKSAGVGIGVLLLFLMARRSLRRRQTELEKALPELLQRGPVSVGELTSGSSGALVQMEGQQKTKAQLQIEELANRKPEDVAALLRTWLLEGARR